MTAPPQFSDEEIIDILNVTRLCSAVMRDTGPDHDRIDLVIPHIPGCAYRFERDGTGWTSLVFTAFDHSALVASGTLAECLSSLTVRSAS
jgi:hypothetical protein